MSNEFLQSDLAIPGSVHATVPQGTSYRQQVGAINCLSYSTQTQLHKCPRKFLLEKLTASNSIEHTDNIDFLYGHAVGGGVQNFLLTGSIEEAMWDSFLSWKGDLSIELPKKKKSFAYALLAVENFASNYLELLQGWELAHINGKPAIELAFSLNMENGYIYLGHIDAVLWHPEDNQLMVLELKTTGFNSINEASYKNSPQALGYSLVVDAIGKELGIESVNYSVLYCVYKCGMLEFEMLPFFKNRAMRAAWLLQLRMDTQIIDFYRTVKHFPTHGESCYDFFRPCEFFGMCEMHQYLEAVKGGMRVANPEDKIEGVEYYFNVSDLDSIAIS